MKILTNLKLEEFSIVRGSDKQPANPEATVLRYKTEPKKEKAVLPKQNAPEEQKAKSLPGKIADAVKGVVDKATTRTVTENYASNSKRTETIEEGGEQPPAEETEMVESAVDKKQTEESPLTGDTLTKAITAGLAPVTDAVVALDSRVDVIERKSTGSRQVKTLETPPSSGGGGEVSFPDFTKFIGSQSGLTPGQRLTKATISTSGWTYGLAVEEANRFIDYIVDESVVLKRIRTERMSGPTKNVDKVGLGSKVLVKGTPGVDPGDTVSLSGPTQVQIASKEVVAIVSVGDDTLEDNIEGDAFIQHLLRMIARAAANELEQAAMHGDTAVADTGILDRWDGWYKLAKAGGAHVTEAMGDSDRYWPGTNGAKATKLLKTLPTKYRQDTRNLAWLLHSDLYLDYNEELASKGYSEAWMAITGIQDVPLRGIQNVQMPLMKTDMEFTHSATDYTDGTVAVLTDLRNLIFGIQRDIRIEPYRQPRKRATDWVLSMRAGVQIENGDAIAIYDHAKVK